MYVYNTILLQIVNISYTNTHSYTCFEKTWTILKMRNIHLKIYSLGLSSQTHQTLNSIFFLLSFKTESFEDNILKSHLLNVIHSHRYISYNTFTVVQFECVCETEIGSPTNQKERQASEKMKYDNERQLSCLLSLRSHTHSTHTLHTHHQITKSDSYNKSWYIHL